MPKRKDAASRQRIRAPAITNQQRGDAGERDVIRKVRCPNCGSKLQQLPPSFPIFDVQCTRCVFRAQVKSSNSAPRDEVFGSGHSVLSHYLKAGQIMPPLIVNFRGDKNGRTRQSIMLFPFLTHRNIRRRVRGKRSVREGYKEFNFVGLKHESTPKVVLFPTAQTNGRS